MGKLGDKAIVMVAATEGFEDEQGNKGVRTTFVEAEGALVKGYLAVHKRGDWDEIKRARPGDVKLGNVKPWRITHTATGFKVRDYGARKEALAVRDALVDSEIDWEFVTVEGNVTREMADAVIRIEREVLNPEEIRRDDDFEAPEAPTPEPTEEDHAEMDKALAEVPWSDGFVGNEDPPGGEEPREEDYEAEPRYQEMEKAYEDFGGDFDPGDFPYEDVEDILDGIGG